MSKSRYGYGMGRGKAVEELGIDPVLEKRMGSTVVMLEVKLSEDEEVVWRGEE
jgi:hypothetical protein